MDENYCENQEKSINAGDCVDQSGFIKDRDIYVKPTIPVCITVVLSALAMGCADYFIERNLLTAVVFFLAGGLMGYLSCVDYKLHLAPNWGSVVFFVLGIPIIVMNLINASYINLLFMVLGMVVCAVPLLIGALTSKNGIGGGDIKVIAGMGFLFGLSRGFVILLAGLLLAIIVNTVKIFINKTDKKKHFALIPYLSIGCFISLFISLI